MERKVTVVGAGNVGATLAQRLAGADLCDVVLVDIPQTEGMPSGKALDMTEAASIVGFDGKVEGVTSYEKTAGSSVVVITAGIPRKPGMSRDDLLLTNAGIVKAVSQQVARHSPNAVILVVANPMDAMAYVALKTTGFPRERVLGMGGVLDAGRMASFLAEELGVSALDIQPMVMGGHGDTMVPLPRFTTVSGVPVTELLPPEKIAAIVQRTRDGGAEIVKLLKTGSAYYAPSAAAAAMVESILLNRKRVMPCSVYLSGEYGLKDVYVGVPAKLGARGLEEVWALKLSPEEQAALAKSAGAVREMMGVLESSKALS